MISRDMSELIRAEFINPEGEPFTINRRLMFYLPGGKTRHLRVNARWIKGCTDKMTDHYPIILIEEGQSIYWNYVEFLDSSASVVMGLGDRSVRLGSTGPVVCR